MSQLWIAGDPIPQPRHRATSRWTDSELKILAEHYPNDGLQATAARIDRSLFAVRQKASDMGLKLNRNGPFFKSFQRRAAMSKVGKKRPGQADVMRRTHAAGKFVFTQERRDEMAKRSREWHRNHEHPRGALGMRHSGETKRLIGQKSVDAWKRMPAIKKRERSVKIMKTRAASGKVVCPIKNGSWKAGWRTVGATRAYFRSRWEANYARVLEWLVSRGQIAKWEHEAETFWFDKIRRGSVSYLPDFRVTNIDGTIEFHEVKGWMDARSKTKLKRMAKYHPSVKLVLIDSKQYKAISKTLGAAVPEWE